MDSDAGAGCVEQECNGEPAIMSDDIVDELNFYAQRVEVEDARVAHLLAEAAGTIHRLRIPMSPGDMFNELVRSLNYDGPEGQSGTSGQTVEASASLGR